MGVKTRSVYCQLPGGRVQDENACGVSSKPAQKRACFLQGCVDKPALWKKGPWQRVRLNLLSTSVSEIRIVKEIKKL